MYYKLMCQSNHFFLRASEYVGIELRRMVSPDEMSDNPLHEKQHFRKNAQRKYHIFLIFRN